MVGPCEIRAICEYSRRSLWIRSCEDVYTREYWCMHQYIASSHSIPFINFEACLNINSIAVCRLWIRAVRVGFWIVSSSCALAALMFSFVVEMPSVNTVVPFARTVIAWDLMERYARLYDVVWFSSWSNRLQALRSFVASDSFRLQLYRSDVFLGSLLW